MRPHPLIAVGVIVALSGHVGVVRADDGAMAPKLEDIERAPSTPGAAAAGAARPLPATVTICQDVATRRCWTESGAAECASGARPDAKVFRRSGSNADPGRVLEECWAALRR